MWTYFSKIIIKNRKLFILLFAVATLFMAYEATKVKLAYNPGKILPATDSTYIDNAAFVKKFGEDGKTMVLGVESSKIFEKDFFNAWSSLTKSIETIKGVEKVVSIANFPVLEKDTVLKKFTLKAAINGDENNQDEIDSLKKLLAQLPFYQDILTDSAQKSTIMVVNFEEKALQAKTKIGLINAVVKKGNDFEKNQNIEIHFSGLPYIKTVVSTLVAKEFLMFLSLSIIISAIILSFFFRNFSAVFFPIVFVIFGVIWSIGIMSIFGYEITLLTGVIPPLMVIIGIPNCILILNKYQIELGKSKNQLAALAKTIEKISLTTFIANLTTAVGFGVLYFTNSNVLKEFGVVAAFGVMFTWIICLCLLPIICSFIKVPSTNSKSSNKCFLFLLLKIDHIVHHQRKLIYYTVFALLIIAGIGIAKISVNGYVVDDLPKDDDIYQDLKFFESRFNGVLPLEISIDAKNKNSILSLSNIKKIERLENVIANYPEVGKGISINNVLKYSSQAFYNGDKDFYRIPNEMEKDFILIYAANAGKSNNMINRFLDKERKTTRITFNMKDVGSKKMNAFIAELRPQIDKIFNPDKYVVKITGPILMYVKGTDYLVYNLRDSLILAILIIAIIMWVLFRGFKMVIISLLPNLIPLLIVAGIMGYIGLALKPSTVLIFSIALGIASDQTIYFLTRYHQELKLGRLSVSKTISGTIMETGFSMIYTAIILFFGFGVFAFSTFGGTVALGVLLAITLVLAMIFNLIFLPALLLSFVKRDIN